LPDDFDYAAAFAAVDLDVLQSEVVDLMTTSQDWWPADWGHYGPFFIRMAWHSAGTYRIHDGRGGSAAGMLRFAPLNSWPDNTNLDKARRLLWPIKKKYGRALSWADLMIFAGNCALESMGFKTYGFAGGREDLFAPEEDVDWGPETEWLGDERYSGDRELANPLGAVQMGLIYVNPEGPNGNPDPLASARDIRETFGRMAMNDEETVALVAGGHTFGKAHGAADPDQHIGREPEGANIEQMGLGWSNSFGSGRGGDTITSGLEGAWTPNPTQWDNGYFDTLFGHEWKLAKSPAGAVQWEPVDDAGAVVPDAHSSDTSNRPMMLTTDIALREDPIYAPISKHFHENPDAFADAFAKAWFKLTHRDMGPVSRYVGSRVPTQTQLWQDVVPPCDHDLVDDAAIAELKGSVLSSGLSVGRLVLTAWASASSYRVTDHRGGADGARVRLEPQRSWAANEPEALAIALDTLEAIRTAFNASRSDGIQISLADLIVLAGNAAIEAAASAAGYSVVVPFRPGRNDASAAQTDADSFAPLEPHADGFRNYVAKEAADRTEARLVDKAHLLGLTAPQMTALVGGMRVLGATAHESSLGVLTDHVGTLTNDFFVNVLDPEMQWSVSPRCEHFYEARDRFNTMRWTGSAVDLVFGSNSQLRAISEVYASDDGADLFVRDFVAAWDHVMNLGRFD
ncbi:MAG: catalase/peroxidase HPI, partial [Phycisphaerales bacterium]|nr:catalase/peroxidase HPI [Phycisphaerales bacterium]